MNFARNKFFIFGVAAGFGLLILYFLILTSVNSFSHALSQFNQFRYWILALTAGFGMQAGLYFFIREKMRQKAMKGSTGVIAATGSVSTASMIVCCLHHFVDVMPLIGLATFALFLSQYQTIFLILGIFSNLIGIIIMLEIVQKNQLSESFTKTAGGFPIGKLKKIAIGASISILLILIFFQLLQFNKSQKDIILSAGNDLSESLTDATSFLKKIDSQGEVTYAVKLLDFDRDRSVRFEIEIDTHSGSLDFDLTKISTLEDDKGNEYQPLDWQGAASGSHHLAGILTFPEVNDKAEKIKLIIKDVSERIFEWDLN